MKLFGLLFLLLAMTSSANAASVRVDVVSATDNPVFQVVAYLEPTSPVEFEPSADIAIMDQINRQFVPHILPVQKGAKVAFPNSDSIKHHVYSFSAAKSFELQLYRGLQAEPLDFGQAGEIELGCNVHDWMLGYIFVVDTPYFSQTNQQGTTQIEVPNGEYRLRIWHPRIQDDNAQLTQVIQVSGQHQARFQLQSPLRKRLDAFDSHQDDFSEYD